MPADVGVQADELYKICSIMGSPKPETWPEGLALAAAMGFRFPQCQPIPLAKMVRIVHTQEHNGLACNWLVSDMRGRDTCNAVAPAIRSLILHS